MSQAGYTPIQLYYSSTAAAAPSAGNLAAGELAVNITDGKLFYKDNGGVVRVLATAAGSAGDVVGPGSSTDNALVRFDGTTGKLVQSSVGVLDDSGNLTGIAALTTSGALTLNAGTANGVAYLNGSKVLTTGSALTFDGTNFGIGTASPDNAGSSAKWLTVDANSGSGYSGGVSYRINGVRQFIQYQDNDNLFAHQGAGSNVGQKFFVGSTEAMRLTSTGLGIGTSSVPSYAGYKTLAINGTSGGEIDFLDGGTTRGQIYSASTSLTVTTLGAIPLLLGTNGTTKATLDSSGNLGLGVTPSAWAGYKPIQAGTGASFGGYAGDVLSFMGSNAYNDNTNWRYIISGNAAARYQQSAGVHQWYTAPSGTAGNAISFTQAMTLNASGQLILNGTSAQTACVLTLQETLGISSALAFKNRNNTQTWNIAVDATAIDDKILAFIDPNAGVVRMGLDSLGNLLVGTTSDGAGIGAPSRLAVRVTSGYAAILRGQQSGNAIVTAWNSSTAGDGVFHEFGTETSYTVRGTISFNRTAGLTAYNTTSDYRAKDIIGPVADSGALIDSVPVYMGKMKGATQERPMFIAHETPSYAHTGEKDAVDKDGKPVFQQMDASALVPVMWAELQSLRARVAELEAA